MSLKSNVLLKSLPCWNDIMECDVIIDSAPTVILIYDMNSICTMSLIFICEMRKLVHHVCGNHLQHQETIWYCLWYISLTWNESAIIWGHYRKNISYYVKMYCNPPVLHFQLASAWILKNMCNVHMFTIKCYSYHL